MSQKPEQMSRAVLSILVIATIIIAIYLNKKTPTENQSDSEVSMVNKKITVMPVNDSSKLNSGDSTQVENVVPTEEEVSETIIQIINDGKTTVVSPDAMKNEPVNVDIDNNNYPTSTAAKEYSVLRFCTPKEPSECKICLTKNCVPEKDGEDLVCYTKQTNCIEGKAQRRLSVTEVKYFDKIIEKSIDESYK